MCKPILMVVIIEEKANLQEIKVSNMKARKVHVDRTKLHPGKERRL